LIPQSFLDDLLQRVDVVDIVGRHVKLKKGGVNYMGLCPFHNEKSPSFSVSPTKQFYHCFGCGAHGSALTFMVEYSGLTFPEAVRELAQSVGMVVPETASVRRVDAHDEPHDGAAAGGEVFDESRSRASSIIEALETANTFYRQTLRGSQRAIDYLKKRGLTGEVAGRFGLGYAPEGWNGLQSAFDDYRSAVLVDAGLVIVKSDDAGGGETAAPASTGRAYDRFRDRVMFPIRNTRGRVIGFGGRVIDEGEPKYLNSPETPVFQKGRELYGLFEARQAIREEGFALVVEGYMDVVALAQHGVANVVATLGTACTPTHVQKLLRQTDRVTFSFDGDAAGRKAAWRALEASLPLATDDKALSFLFLPAEHDPDSYIREHGRDGFLNMVKAALPLSEYVMREVARPNDLRTAEGRAKALFDARPLVKALPTGALRMQIVRALSSTTGAAVEEITDSFQIRAAPTSRRERPRKIERRAPQGLAQRALRALIMYPMHAHALTASDLKTLEEAAGESRDLVVETVEAAKQQGHEVDFVAMSDALRESPNREVYEGLMQEILVDDENKRDLLMRGVASERGEEDDDQREARRHEQQALQAHELRDTIRKMREQSIVAELARISSAGLSEEAHIETYRRLVDERDRLRRG
jgi:DNA primase